jgi:flagellar biogenesis protein FliO
MLWTSTLALAAPLATPADAPVVDPVKYLVACMGVLGLLAAGLFALRKLVVGAQRTRAAGRSLAVLDQLHLGGSKRLTVVRCYDRQFVLGVGDKEIAVVAELDVDQAVPPLPENAAAHTQPANAQLSNTMPAQPVAEAPKPAAREAFQGLLQRAQKLADTIVPPRRAKTEEPQLPVATVQPKRAEQKPQSADQAAAEPTPEVKAKVARELLAKLGPDHELLGAVRAAAGAAPERRQREAQPKRKARTERRPDTAAPARTQAARPARAEQPAADEGWLG